MSLDLFNINTNNLFQVAASQNAQKQQFALQSLEKGLTQFTEKNYTGAIENLKRAIALAPTAESAINAYDYLSSSYINTGNTEAAIETLKTSIKAAPSRDSTRIALGNLYTTLNRFNEARIEYENAVKLNPSPANRYSLGQGYLAIGLMDEAKQQFELVHQAAPLDPQGKFGVGQALAKAGRYDQAVSAFQSAISIRKDYWQAYTDLGYALMDAGRTDEALAVADILARNDAGLGAILNQYIYEKSNPRMLAVISSDFFPNFIEALGPRTLVRNLDPYLSTPSSELTMAMQIVFSKPMDRQSVENVNNWSISRANGSGPGEAYNNGISVADTEINIDNTPEAVFYNANSQSATVLFRVRQNDTGNGTIDPSHINFTFKGIDEFQLTMDPSADMYSGFSGFA